MAPSTQEPRGKATCCSGAGVSGTVLAVHRQNRGRSGINTAIVQFVCVSGVLVVPVTRIMWLRGRILRPPGMRSQSGHGRGQRDHWSQSRRSRASGLCWQLSAGRRRMNISVPPLLPYERVKLFDLTIRQLFDNAVFTVRLMGLILAETLVAIERPHDCSRLLLTSA